MTKAKAPASRPTQRRDPRPLVGREEPDAPSNKSAEQIENQNLKIENPIEQLPPAIVKDRFAVNYLRPHFEYDAKLDKRTVGLEISLKLRGEHAGVIPKEICVWWQRIKEGCVKSIALLDIPMQYVELGLVPEQDDKDLQVKAAPVEKVALAVIESTGEGQEIEVIRLTLRIALDLDSEIERFACRHFGKVLWMKMRAIQGTLL